MSARASHSIAHHGQTGAVRIEMRALLVVAVFAAQVIFRRATYDEWLPMTYFAKSGGFWAFDAGEYVRDEPEPLSDPFVGPDTTV